jgi:hypothetical protein
MQPTTGLRHYKLFKIRVTATNRGLLCPSRRIGAALPIIRAPYFHGSTSATAKKTSAHTLRPDRGYSLIVSAVCTAMACASHPHMCARRTGGADGRDVLVTTLALLLALMASSCDGAMSAATPFSAQGPALAISTPGWSLFLPLSASKASGRSGLLLHGDKAYTFPAPRTKVRVRTRARDHLATVR